MPTRRARDPALLDKVDSLRREDYVGEVWRVGREGREPTLGYPSNARWDPGTFDVLYTSEARDGALSEVFFHLSRQPVFPSKIRSVVCRLTVSVSNMLWLPDVEHVGALGMDTSRYGALDYTASREIGDAAFFLGFDGMIVPSARAPCLNVVLFTERLADGAIELRSSEPVDWNEWRRSRGPREPK